MDDINVSLLNQIKEVLIKLGISPVLMGYNYLAHCVYICAQDNQCVYCLVSKVYKEVAKLYNTTYQCVERNIRHSIKVFVERRHVDALNKLMHAPLYTAHDYPSCGELIGYLAEYVRLHCDLTPESHRQ